MALPSPALSVPTLLADQLYYQGVTIGYPPNTPFGITKLEGLDSPDVRSGDTDRAQQRGAIPGLNQEDSRTITATMDVAPPFGSYTNLQGALGALRSAASTAGSAEYPLWIQIPGLGLVCTLARVVKRTSNWDLNADLGALSKDLPMQWKATDPYLYSAPTQIATVGLPTPGRGFSFPLSFNWSFGGGTTANQVTVTNLGNVNCWPILSITGPCLNPHVSNASLPGNPTVALNIQLNAGDQLLVDCDTDSVVYYAAGSTTGVPSPQLLGPGAVTFPLPPAQGPNSISGGNSLIEFNSQDTSAAAGQLSVWYASAYDGLI